MTIIKIILKNFVSTVVYISRIFRYKWNSKNVHASESGFCVSSIQFIDDNDDLHF